MIPSKAYTADIAVGASTWYAWWDYDQIRRDVNFDLDPAFFYGPAVSIKFNDDFNLTFIYLYGKFYSDFASTHKYESGYSVLMTGRAKINRSDSDLAFNCRLNNFFKIFVGIKYMNFEAQCLLSVVPLYTSPVDANYVDNAIEQSGIGPGLGLSANLPISENLFLLGTLSGFYLWGNEKEYFSSISYSAGSIYSQSETNSKNKYKEYGINSNLSFAYYIASESMTINLGGRFQYLKTNYKESSVENGTHKFYGCTLSATYTFSI